MSKFIKDVVVIATHTQRYGCGSILLRRDAIVKIMQLEGAYVDHIFIYRDKYAENLDRYFQVEVEFLRLATDEEVVMYNEGIRNLPK